MSEVKARGIIVLSFRCVLSRCTICVCLFFQVRFFKNLEYSGNCGDFNFVDKEMVLGLNCAVKEST